MEKQAAPTHSANTKPRPRRQKKIRMNLLITSADPALAIVELAETAKQLLKSKAG